MRSNKRRIRKKTIKSKIELDRSIGEVIYSKWPELVTQKYIAEKLDISQPLVSKRLSAWKKEGSPLELKFKDQLCHKSEELLKETYNLKDVLVLKNINVRHKSYYDQIGIFSSNLLTEKINKRQKEKQEIRVTHSCGDSVFHTLKHLAANLDEENKQLVLSSCITTRSTDLLKLSPMHIGSSLLTIAPNVRVSNTFHLPEIFFDEEKEIIKAEEDIVAQRVRTQRRLNIDKNLLNSDIVVFGVRSIDNSNEGFMRHIRNLDLQHFLETFGIIGHIAYSPFSKKHGFLFHNLINDVFPPSNTKNCGFKYDLETRIDRLNKYSNTKLSKHANYLTEAVRFFSHIFTVNFCIPTKEWKIKENKVPYVLMIAGGEPSKSKPLKVLLEMWKDNNIVDGLVTSEDIVNNF